MWSLRRASHSRGSLASKFRPRKGSGRRYRHDEAGTRLLTRAPTDQLAHGLGARAGGQLAEQLAPSPEERAQRPRDGQHDMAMGDQLQHTLAQLLGPENLRRTVC